MPVEKNDVDISTLFNWRKEFILEGKDGSEEKVYIRLVGDAELNRARVYALRKSSDLRTKLKDVNSDERVVYIRDVSDVDDREIVAMIQALSIRDITQQSYRDIDIPYPKEPASDASLEKQEEFQKQVDQYNYKMAEAVKGYVEDKMKKLENELSAMSKEELVKQYEKRMMEELCEQEMLNYFRDMCTYFGTFKDENYKERYFSSVEDFQNLPSSIKMDFVNAYISLELSSEELKKLRGVMQ